MNQATSAPEARQGAERLFAGSGAISQLWLFWVAPFIGALIGGGLYKWLGAESGPDMVGKGK